jgi:hypothetical protein
VVDECGRGHRSNGIINKNSYGDCDDDDDEDEDEDDLDPVPFDPNFNGGLESEVIKVIRKQHKKCIRDPIVQLALTMYGPGKEREVQEQDLERRRREREERKRTLAEKERKGWV